MTGSFGTIGLIIVLGAITYFLRVVPVLFPTRPHPFVTYASYAIIGAITSTSAFSGHVAWQWPPDFTSNTWAAAATLALTLALSIHLRKGIVCLAIGIAFYAGWIGLRQFL